MKTEIVVARYNENLDWLKKIPKSIKITVYNKGNNDISYPYIQLPNIGRESHTYLYHIIKNYNNLADQTIFCQGDSIFHSPDFLNLIKNRKYFEPIQPLSAYYCPEEVPSNYLSNPPLIVLESTKNLHIKGNRVHVEYLDNDFITQYPYHYDDMNFIKYINKVKELYNIQNVLEFNVERFRLKNVDLNKLIPICYAGLFCVTKDVIQENSIDFYNNIMSILIYDIRYIVSNKKLDHGLFLEKLWLLIFNYKKNNKNYIDLNVKDYLMNDYNLIIKNNSIKFKLFIITCNIYIELYIDNILYSILLLKNLILFRKYKKILIKKEDVIHNKDIQEVLKYTHELEINISLINNVLIVTGNKTILLKYVFKNITKINSAKIFSISKDNKFIDLNNNLNLNTIN